MFWIGHHFHFSTYRPWPNDVFCKRFITTFSVNKTLPSVGLYSFPISGNTFTRYLIESMTGTFSGSFYDSICIAAAGKQWIFQQHCKSIIVSQESKYYQIYNFMFSCRVPRRVSSIRFWSNISYQRPRSLQPVGTGQQKLRVEQTRRYALPDA